MDFFEEAGKVALGSRLRRLGDLFAADAAEIFQMYRVPLKPNWFPVFHLLSRTDESSITKLAREIGYSHPVISLIVRDMTKAGLTTCSKSSEDGRLTVVRLTEQGRAALPGLDRQIKDVEDAVNELLAEMEHDVWSGIEELEDLLKTKSFHDRVAQIRRDSKNDDESGEEDEI